MVHLILGSFELFKFHLVSSVQLFAMDSLDGAKRLSDIASDIVLSLELRRFNKLTETDLDLCKCSNSNSC